MSWSVIRQATDTDRHKLQEAATAFCERHGIVVDGGDPVFEIECMLNSSTDRAKKLAPLWRRIVRRALDSKNAEGIAYGCVGFHVD